MRIGGRDIDVALVVSDLLLRGVLKIARGLGALAEHLNDVHHVLRLVEPGVAELGGPGEVLIHLAEDIGKGGEGFNAGIPGLHVGLGGDGVGRSVAHGLAPAISLGDLRGVCRGGENLSEQRVRIECDGGNELLDLILGHRGLGLLGVGLRVLLLIRIGLLLLVLRSVLLLLIRIRLLLLRVLRRVLLIVRLLLRGGLLRRVLLLWVLLLRILLLLGRVGLVGRWGGVSCGAVCGYWV